MHKKLLWVCLLWLLPLWGYSQAYLQKSFTLSEKDNTVESLLHQISAESGLTFSYSSQLFDGRRVLQLSPATYTLQELLYLVFNSQGIDYIIQGKNIILTPMATSRQLVRVSGALQDSANNQPLYGATIYFPELHKGVATDSLGRFTISIPSGAWNLQASLLGYKAIEQRILFTHDSSFNFLLSSKPIVINEVSVKGIGKDNKVESLTIGKEYINVENVQSMPALLGETDILKSLQLLPGIQSTGEGMSGLLVRGGSADQTLVMLNDATVYSPSHFMGFFSVFSPESIEDVEIYKGGIPARWGGRLSAVVNNTIRTGNKEHFEASGGLGFISSRLSLEGPIVKNKASYLISGRRTYFDLLLKAIPSSDMQANDLYFYDLNGSVHYTLNENNQFRLSAYEGDDVARFYQFIRVDWGNRIISGEWLHSFSPKLVLNTAFHYSRYAYGFRINLEDELDFRWTSKLEEYSSRLDFDYQLNKRNSLQFGYQANRRTFSPVNLYLRENTTEHGDIQLDRKHVLEHALYIQNEHQLSERFSMLYGLRYSLFHNLGPSQVFLYETGQPLTLENITDTLHYNNNEIINTYHGPEPRITLSYSLDKHSSAKVNYSRMRQYTQVASSATASLPTDRWIPSDVYIKPQIGDQWSAGYFREIKRYGLDLSAEAYYKIMHNQIDFKDGVAVINNINNQNADILFNNALETQLLSGRAWSYGLELMLRKKEGKLSGWLAYTYARTKREIFGINSNTPYSPRYDRPHDLSLVSQYKLNKRIEFGGTWVYSSGSPVTLPQGKYTFEGREVPYYNPAVRNNSRLPDYHRLDLSVTLHNKKNEERRWKSDWTFSIYNTYMRRNPLFIQFVDVINNDPNLGEDEVNEVYSRELKGVTVFLSIIPAISYNFRF